MPATYTQIRDNALDILNALSGSKSVSINGRTWTGEDRSELRETIDWAEAKILAAASPNRAIVSVAEFAEPSASE